MNKLLIFLLSLCVTSLEAATITNWGAQLPTAVPASGDVILMQKGGVTYYFTPNQLATQLSTNANLIVAGSDSNALYLIETTRNGAVSNGVVTFVMTTSNTLYTTATTPSAPISSVPFNSNGVMQGSSSFIYTNKTVSISIPPTAGTRFLELSPSATGERVPFGFVYNYATYPGGGLGGETYTNDVLGWGWNINSIGTGFFTNKQATWYGMENKFLQGGEYGSEVHLETVDTNSVRHRPWHWFLQWDGGGGFNVVQADTFSLNDWSGGEKIRFRMDANAVDVGRATNAVAFYFLKNNEPILYQRNAADSAYLTLPWINNEDRLKVDQGFVVTGPTLTTGAYTNIFCVIDPDTLPANGQVLNISGPTITGDAYAVKAAMSVSASLFHYLENQGNGNATYYARAVGTGDPTILFQTGTNWSMGIDQSDENKFKLALSSALGTQDALTVTTNRQFLIGTSVPNATTYDSKTPVVQIAGISSAASMSVTRYSANALGPTIVLGKSGGATVGDFTIVTDGANLGRWAFCGADGVDLDTPGAYIQASVQGSPAANSIPGNLQFHTHNGITLLERVRILPNGNFGIGTTNAASSLDVTGQVRNVSSIITNSVSLLAKAFEAPASTAFTTSFGAHLWSDGTNLCVVLENSAGTRTTNKLSMTAWP